MDYDQFDGQFDSGIKQESIGKKDEYVTSPAGISEDEEEAEGDKSYNNIMGAG